MKSPNAPAIENKVNDVSTSAVLARFKNLQKLVTMPISVIPPKAPYVPSANLRYLMGEAPNPNAPSIELKADVPTASRSLVTFKPKPIEKLVTIPRPIVPPKAPYVPSANLRALIGEAPRTDAKTPSKLINDLQN